MHSELSETPARAASLPETGPGIYWLLLLLGLGLLLLTPWQASWVETSRGWFVQPRMGSSLGLLVLTLFALVRVGQFARAGVWPAASDLLNSLPGYRTALLSSLLFLLYIGSLSVLGFVLSTLLFVATLLWLSRLLDRFWLLVTLGTVLLLVLVFRVGVSVWLPDVWLYGLLPEQWADFANRYL
ncbi:hypothetical protein [Parathalassolituus penaei]|uniref:Tripartite tricarboxylate transporter TctB family protein n=1 Tax=Parathalassolituus penaei TaxID=2997323 RepID=A0A9X3EEZ0_9GAMM|nr:hypothetical protein [Parathalassolituus penaei]MCY0966312.1 hypothetical protein [Parathalassolituus penaei]